MAKKRKNFIREKRIYCGEEYLEDVKATLYCYKKMEEDIERRKGKC